MPELAVQVPEGGDVNWFMLAGIFFGFMAVSFSISYVFFRWLFGRLYR